MKPTSSLCANTCLKQTNKEKNYFPNVNVSHVLRLISEITTCTNASCIAVSGCEAF